MFLMPTPAPFLKPTSFTLHDTGTGTGGTVTVPAGVQAGDIIMVGHGDRVSVPSVGSGMTEIAKAGNTNGGFTDSGITTCFKVSDGTETTITGFTGTQASWCVAVFRPNVAASSGVVTGTSSYAGTGNPAANVMGISASSSATVAIYAIWEAGNTTPTGSFTGVSGVTTLTTFNGTHGIVVYLKAQDAGSGSDITADVGDIGVQASASGYLEIS